MSAVNTSSPIEMTFAREGRVVQELATQSGPSTEYAIGQAQTWLNAFCIFRKIEDSIGLPIEPGDRKAYFLILSTLISAGEYLLTKIKPTDTLLHEVTKVSLDGFRGCLELLRDAMEHFQRQFTPEQLEAIRQRAFDGQAAA